jgi:hypothetical protein
MVENLLHCSKRALIACGFKSWNGGILLLSDLSSEYPNAQKSCA